MPTREDKDKREKRIHNANVHIKKQIRIGKSHGLSEAFAKDIQQPHRLNKHHVMDCGNPKCIMCSNPRKTFNELTPQEQRLFQDVENVRNTHGNGLVNKQEELDE